MYCLHISGIAEARNFKFGAQIDHTEYYRENSKLGHTGTQVTLLTFKFWHCLHISGIAEARNFKFGARIDNRECYRKNAKLGHVGTQPTSRDLLLNFGTASMSPEWLKLETSNLVSG